MGVHSTAWPDASEARIPPSDATRLGTPRRESDLDWRKASIVLGKCFCHDVSMRSA